jgi:hypothetical protein
VPSLNADEVVRLSELRICRWQHLAERMPDRLSSAAITQMKAALPSVGVDHANWIAVVIDVNNELRTALPPQPSGKRSQAGRRRPGATDRSSTTTRAMQRARDGQRR